MYTNSIVWTDETHFVGGLFDKSGGGIAGQARNDETLNQVQGDREGFFVMPDLIRHLETLNQVQGDFVGKTGLKLPAIHLPWHCPFYVPGRGPIWAGEAKKPHLHTETDSGASGRQGLRAGELQEVRELRQRRILTACRAPFDRHAGPDPASSRDRDNTFDY